MLGFCIRRLLLLIPVLFLISVISFSLVHFSQGDAAENALRSPDGGLDQKMVDEFKEMHGLDLPIHVQYLNWMGNVLRGDLGKSIMTGESVTGAMYRCFSVTLRLAIASMLVSLIIAIPLGVISALRAGGLIDDLCRLFALTGISMPSFWQAYLLIMLFSVYLKVLPSGYMGKWGLADMVLPSIVLGTGYAASTMRLMRNSMLDVLQQDYVRAARAKGVSEFMVVFKHALKNALLPVVTVAGLNFAYLLNGSVIVETIFCWPGFGNLILSSLLTKDYPVIQGCILFVAVLFVFINFFVDLSYAYLNPRIKYDGKM